MTRKFHLHFSELHSGSSISYKITFFKKYFLKCYIVKTITISFNCFSEYLANTFYQSPLILTELFQHNLINVVYLTACYLYQVMMTLHFLNDVANDAESTQK